MQNSLDAVRELSALRASGSVELPDPTPSDKPEVAIDFVDSGEDSYVLIADNGIGMNAEIVQSYFLNAGASYRQSSAWADLFKDNSGKSRVYRSGRFGVGVLAAFLIGDQIDVTTRRYDEPSNKGIQFRANLEDDQVQLNYVNAPVGTSIKIKTDSRVIARLRGDQQSDQVSYRADWFTLSEPKVVTASIKDGQATLLKQRIEAPLPSRRRPRWLAFDSPERLRLRDVEV